MPRRICLVSNFDFFPGLAHRSNAKLEYDRFLHSYNYPCIIHPYSKFRYYWEFASCVSIFLQIFLYSISYMFIHGHYQTHLILFIFNCHALLDLFLNFFTGYVEGYHRTVILIPRKIIQNYLKTWFIIDFLGALPIESLSYFYPNCFSKPIQPLSAWNCHHVVDLLAFTFVFRVFAFHRYFNKIAKLKLVNVFWVRTISVNVWTFCLFVLFENINSRVPELVADPSNTWLGDHDFLCKSFPKNCSLTQRLQFILQSVISLSDEQFLYYKDHELVEIFSRMAFYFCFFFFTIFVTAIYIDVGITLKNPREKFYEVENCVLDYVKHKHFPKALARNVYLYFQTLLEKGNHNADEMYEFLPKSEFMNLTLSSTLPIIKNNPVFMDLPLELLKQLAYIMRYEVYVPFDVLVQAGTLGQRMFFIVHGTVAMYSSKFVRLVELEDGDFFGAKSIIFPKKELKSSAVAVKICTVYYLDRDDFLQVMESYPNILDDLQRKLLEEKMQRFQFGSY